jgi:hypothetical protein
VKQRILQANTTDGINEQIKRLEVDNHVTITLLDTCSALTINNKQTNQITVVVDLQEKLDCMKDDRPTNYKEDGHCFKPDFIKGEY